MALIKRGVSFHFKKIEKVKYPVRKTFLLSFAFIGSVVSISPGVSCDRLKDPSNGSRSSQRPAPDSPQILCGNYPSPFSIDKATGMFGCSEVFLEEQNAQPFRIVAYSNEKTEENIIEPKLLMKLMEDYNRLQNFKVVFERRERASQIRARKKKAVEDAASNITPVREGEEDDAVDELLDDFELIPSSNDKKDQDESREDGDNIEVMEVIEKKEPLSSSSSSSSWSSFASIGMSYLNQGITFISKEVENFRLTKAQKEYEVAQRQFVFLNDSLAKIAEDVRNRYAALTHFGKIDLSTYEKIKAFADRQRSPTEYHAPYQTKPSTFKREERFLAFVEDPLDFEITLSRLPGIIDRLKQENKALVLLNELYKKHIGSLKTDWGHAKTWKARIEFLKNPEDAIETIKEELRKAIPFNNPAKYKRDFSSYEQMVLNVLHLDDLGLCLKTKCFMYIEKIPHSLPLAEANENALEKGKEMRARDEKYWVLPKFGEQAGSQQALISFKEIYTGSDSKENKEDFYEIIQRTYQAEQQSFKPFVLPKGTIGASEFRQYACMDFHRTYFINVLEQLNSKVSYDDIFLKKPSGKTFRAIPRKVSLPILIGAGEGLTPIEFDPTDAPLGMRYLLPHMETYYSLYRKLEEVLTAQRVNIKQLYESRPTLLGNFLPADQRIPSPIDFVPFIIPERPKPQRIWDEPQVLNLKRKSIEDYHLESTYRISSDERRGLFYCCSWLNLKHNSLKNPKSGEDFSRLTSFIDFSSLTSLNVSDNELENLEFLNGLWGQLRVLKASSNSISAFHPRGEMGDIPLHTLDLSENQLHKFKLEGGFRSGFSSLDNIGYFINLRTLNISNNAFGTLLPLRELQNLEYLEAKGCDIEGTWIDVLPSRFKKLTFLDLSKNPKLNFFPYESKETVTDDDIRENDGNFQGYFPALKTFIGTRKLEAVEGVIALSKLRSISGEPIIEGGEIEEREGEEGELFYDDFSLSDEEKK